MPTISGDDESPASKNASDRSRSRPPLRARLAFDDLGAPARLDLLSFLRFVFPVAARAPSERLSRDARILDNGPHKDARQGRGRGGEGEGQWVGQGGPDTRSSSPILYDGARFLKQTEQIALHSVRIFFHVT